MGDMDKSGTLEFSELKRAPDDVQDVLHDVAGTANDHELHVIFDALDVDNTGQIDISEFCEGLIMIQEGNPIEIMCIQKHCREMLRLTKNIQASLRQASVNSLADIPREFS